MSLQRIFNRFSIDVDVVSNENFYRFRIETLSLCKAITLLVTELRHFSPEQRPLGSVSIIEPEAPGVLLRFPKRRIFLLFNLKKTRTLQDSYQRAFQANIFSG